MSQKSSNLLRYALRADAAFCALAGLDAILFSKRIAEFLGVADARFLTFLGVGLFAWAAHLLIASRRELMSLREAWYFVSGGLLWIAGSAVLILAGPFTFSGNVVVGAIAVGVMAFTEAQYLGIRRIRSQQSPNLVRQAA